MFLASALLLAAAARTVPPPAPPPDRVVLVTADDAEYRALAIPRSYKTSPSAPMHLLVFKGGLCVRDFGLTSAQSSSGTGTAGQAFVEEQGSMERGFVAADGSAGAIVRTRYLSRVDVTPGKSTTENDTVTGGTSLTFIDPSHPEGSWQITVENARWVKDVVVLPGAHGVALMTFQPRNGPNDVRVLDASGREAVHVPEDAADTVRIASSPEGDFVAADVAFRDNPLKPERGVMVFNVARGSYWTYGWRYGSDDEPTSWSIESRGVLAVRLQRGTVRYDATGAKL